MSLIKEEYYIVKQAGVNDIKLAGYKNTVYDNYPSALQRADEVCKASGKEMLVFRAITRLVPVQTIEAKLESL